jgi:ubiquinone/menaquinone biosynthesis C-methylase UbiE
MNRTLEPEVMDTEEEAREYDAMDHGDVNARFCEDLLAAIVAPAQPRRLLDVGTGTARIPIELATRCSSVVIDAIDLAAHMLALGRINVCRAGFSPRITLHLCDAKATGFAAASFDAVVSNSIIHHIPEPAGVLAEMWRLLECGGTLFVRDLLRPDTSEQVRALVDTYAADSTEGQRALFDASLRAALTVDEVRELVAPIGIAPQAVQQTSDRHWTLARRKP